VARRVDVAEIYNIIGTPMPSFRDVTAAQWKAFAAAFLAWALDGFDATVLTFVLIDIQRSFSVDYALVGALGTVQLVFRVAGGVGAGTAADRWGRKGPLMFSVLWYSIFACASGFSTSYRMLFAMRALFGIGMGGVWAAGMPLAIEHWPARLRGAVSGILQGGYSVGYIFAAFAYQIVYPMASQHADRGWRVMMWIGVLPALLVFWIMTSVAESPVWIARQERLHDRGERHTLSLARLFTADLLPATIQTSLLMGAFMVAYQSITFWYPKFLATIGRAPLPFLLALNGGGIVGAALWGRLSETRLGRRGAFTLAMGAGIAATPLYLFATSGWLLWLGALSIGLFAAGSLGVMPGYLAERFPTEARAAGAGFAYHVGAGLGAFAPYLVGALQDRGMALPPVMGACIVGAGLLMILFVWLGPETRGREMSRVT
jgi:SHS family lactate transporter-like MFS transporter